MKNLYNSAVSYCSKLLFIFSLLFSFKSNAQESMRANLYVMDASGPVLMDGNLTEYNSAYSNDVDIYDAWKMSNPGANFSIYRTPINLAVERRNLVKDADTTFFRIWNMPKATYNIKFTISNMDNHGLHCFVKDNYLRTETPVALDKPTDYEFTINTDPGSYAEMRFQLIFGKDIPAPVEVSFEDTKATRKGKDILVNWKVANEITILSYIIEHSNNGINFSSHGEVISNKNNVTTKAYDYSDVSVPVAANYYRVKAVNTLGRTQYSAVVKVQEAGLVPAINIYPNPVISKTVQLQFDNVNAGKYNVVLVHNNGMQQPLASFILSETQRNGSVSLPKNLAPGIYRLIFTGANDIKIVKTINVIE